MNLLSRRSLAASLLVAALGLADGQAAVSPEEAEQLGKNLTPVGAERAGNADGSIPSWEGGLTRPVPGFVPGGQYPDPYAGEQPLFTIDASNLEQYKAKLTPGQIALLRRYPDWKMPVYPTHRSAALPAQLYEETRRNATQVQLVEGGVGFTGTTGGVPFPIPRNGLEAIWNHITGYLGGSFTEFWSQAAVTVDGDYTLVRFENRYYTVYSDLKTPPEARTPNVLAYALQIVKAPPRLAGGVILVHEFANQLRQPRKAWSYSPGQRRVRLAPNVGYDNPGTGADGLRTNDDFNMFNGATDRYDWTLVEKRELYVPYNSYRLNSRETKSRALLQKGHINPQNARYELHRVWVVDAKLKRGTSHLYKRRTFYLDEDSWQALVQDKYDNRDQLWRVDEQHGIVYYDVPFLARGLEVKHDLQLRRYLVMRLRNEEKTLYQPIQMKPDDFTPETLRTLGTR